MDHSADTKKATSWKFDVFHILVKIPGDGNSTPADIMQHYIAIAKSEENAIRLVKDSAIDTVPGITYSVKAATVALRQPDDTPMAQSEQLYRI